MRTLPITAKDQIRQIRPRCPHHRRKLRLSLNEQGHLIPTNRTGPYSALRTRNHALRVQEVLKSLQARMRQLLPPPGLCRSPTVLQGVLVPWLPAGLALIV